LTRFFNLIQNCIESEISKILQGLVGILRNFIKKSEIMNIKGLSNVFRLIDTGNENYKFLYKHNHYSFLLRKAFYEQNPLFDDIKKYYVSFHDELLSAFKDLLIKS